MIVSCSLNRIKYLSILFSGSAKCTSSRLPGSQVFPTAQLVHFVSLRIPQMCFRNIKNRQGNLQPKAHCKAREEGKGAVREGGMEEKGEGGMIYKYVRPTVRVWISFCPIDPFPYICIGLCWPRALGLCHIHIIS